MSDNRPNVLCPHPSCCQGKINAGMDLNGLQLSDICPTCKGYGFLTAEEDDERKASEFHTTIGGVRVLVQPWLGKPFDS